MLHFWANLGPHCWFYSGNNVAWHFGHFLQLSFLQMHLENPEYFQWHSHKKSGRPIYFNGLVRKPFHFAHMAFHIISLTILTLPFSLTTSKGQNFKTFQNVVYSAFSAWWGKPHSGSVTPFEILKYFPYRNFAPGWFLEAVVEAKKTKQDVTETAGTQRSLALFMAYPTPPHQKTLHTFILMLETR